MAKRYVGFINYFRGKIDMAALFSFDTKRLTKADKELLKSWEAGEAKEYEDTLLDSVYPEEAWFIIDSQFEGPEKYSLEVTDDIWPVYIQNIFKTFNEAFEEVYEHKKNILNQIFEYE